MMILPQGVYIIVWNGYVRKKLYLCTANEKWVHPLREYVLNCRPYDDTQSVDG